MSTLIKHKRSGIPGRIPSANTLSLGEIAINTADAKLFIKQEFTEYYANGNIVSATSNTVTVDDATGAAVGQDITIGADTKVITGIDFGNNIISVSEDWDSLPSNTDTFDVTNTNISVSEISPDAGDLLADLLTVDGANSGLDADLLDGEEGSYYLDYNNFTNVPPATFDLTLDGKVTGTAFSNTGVMTLTTELANTGVTPGTYGSPTAIPVITVDEDGRITVANTSAVAGVEDFFFVDANNTITLETGDGTIYLARINKLDRIEEDLTVELTGDVTGTVTSNTGIMSVVTDIANTGVVANTYGSSTEIPIFTVGEDGRITNANTAEIITTLTVTLEGDVTGTITSSNGNLTLQTDVANSGVIAGNYGSPTQIPVLTIDNDGRITNANTSPVAGVDDFYWTPANNTLILETGDGTTYAVEVDTFYDTINANNITLSGTIDGRDPSVDGTKLDGIEDGATADQTPTEILNSIKTVDGAGSGLDADTLDTFHASDILAQAANNAADQIGNGLITITANNGLIGSGFFSLNDFSNTAISFQHANTSTETSSDNANGVVIQDVLIDSFGHVTGLGSTDLDDRYYTEVELDAGQLDNRYYTETELDGFLNDKADKVIQIIVGDGLSGGGDLSSNVTISHANTSDVANVVSVADKEVINEVTFDQFGHVVTANTKVLDFISQAEADIRYVNVTGDTMTGNLVIEDNLVVEGTISQNESQFKSEGITASPGAQTTILSFSKTDYDAAEVIVSVQSGINKHITKLLIVHDGTTAYATEYGTVFTNAELRTFDVEIFGDNVLLKASAAFDIVTFKVFATLIAS